MLDHPFESDKGRLLSAILAGQQETEPIEEMPLLAVFPELYLRRGSYAAQVVPMFSLRSFRAGDRSEAIIDGARAHLQALGLWEQEMVPAQTIEEMATKERAARFLATHYYYHGMFAWFWKMFDAVQSSAGTQLLMRASEVAFYEQAPMEAVEVYYDRCFADDTDDELHQRLYHRLAVMYALRREWATAEQHLEMSLRLFPAIRSELERRCRLAEWHNAKALLHTGHDEQEAAVRELEKAFHVLAACDSSDGRVREVRGVLLFNQHRLQNRMQEWEAE